MKKNSELIIKLTFQMKDGSRTFTLKPIGCNKEFIFDLNDDTYDNLDAFIDFLLENVTQYDSLNIAIENENKLNEPDKNLCSRFQEVWESEFKQIKKELKDFDLENNND